MIRYCNYRNCKIEITHMRKNALYCCKNHKLNEKKYRKREDIKIEKEKKRISDILLNYQNEVLLNLYKKIYKKCQ